MDNNKIYKTIKYNKNCQKKLKKKNVSLKKRYANTYKFGNHYINKSILLLRKGAFPYEYMSDWEKVNEALLPEKEVFYNNLNVEDITDVDYKHRKIICKDFKK